MEPRQHVSTRRYDIDWLRVFAVLLLIYFHTARVFNHEDFYVKNDTLSRGMDIFIGFVNQWHMPLFFFVSGVGTWFALGSRTAGGYANDRFKRLMIPLLFGSSVIVPPQIYLMRVGGRGYGHLVEPGYQGSYFHFYPHFFNGIPPRGNWEWGHLWFLAYLFTFSLVALPIFLYLKKEGGKDLVSKLASTCERPWRIFLLAAPLIIIEALLRPTWPGTNNLYSDWANFFYYLTFFIYGYILCGDERFFRAISKHGKTALGLGIGCVIFYLALDSSGHVPERSYSLGSLLVMALRGFNSWCWLVGILYLGQRHLNFTSRTLRYANEAALPFYILHQTVIVMIAYYVVRWQMGVSGKFWFITTASLVSTVVIYDVFIKQSNIMRFLFGMKPKRAYQKIILKEASPEKV